MTDLETAARAFDMMVVALVSALSCYCLPGSREVWQLGEGRGGLAPLPATPETVKDDIFHLRHKGNKLSTIDRALSSISLSHRLAGLTDPAQDEGVRWRMKGLRRDLGNERRTARPLRFRAGAVAVADNPRIARSG